MANDPSYQVIARRYRPQTFEEVVGQEHVATTLTNAISENRVAHAYIFTGTRGVGKTSMARILAKALNCARGPTGEPCGDCASCREITDGSSPDVIEIDAASNTGVDDVRGLRESIQYLPLRSRRKIYIVDEAHMLSKAAWNAFLKTLEEPPPHAAFIFATTEANRLPETIRSRCQPFEFRRITTDDIVRRLGQVCAREKVKAAEDVLRAVARAGRGSMRDAQSLLDQVIAASGADAIARADVDRVVGALPGERLTAVLDAVERQDLRTLFETVDALVAEGHDQGLFLEQLADHCRQLLVVQACGPASPLVDAPDDLRAKFAEQAKLFPVDRLLAFAQVLADARRRLRDVANARLLLEITLVKLARLRDLQTVADLVDRLARAEAPGAAVDPATAAPAPRVATESPRPAPPSPAPAPAAPAAAAAPARAVRESAPPPPAPLRPASPPPPATAKPSPAPAPPSASPVAAENPAGPVDLELVRKNWGRILERAGAEKKPVQALLREGEPRQLSGLHLTIAFDKAHTFHMSGLEGPDRMAVVENAVAAVVGRRLAVKLALSDTPVTPLVAPRDPDGEPPDPERLPDGPATGGAEAGGSLPPPAGSGGDPRDRSEPAPEGTAAGRNRNERIQEARRDPIVLKAEKLFDARVLNVED